MPDMKESTDYPHVNALLDHLVSQMQTILGPKFVGLYLFGSLVMGDYDDGTSDVDLLAATSSDIDQAEFEALKKMHEDIVAKDPRWDNHIEVAYLSLEALKTFKIRSSPIGIISPGEPFHIKEAGKDWLVNWYFVREKGVTLFGPPPKSIIEPISKDEFIQIVKDHAGYWRERSDDMRSRPGQSYAILTMCRALYTITNGEQVSKRQAALWAAKQLPEWSTLINNALVWRKAAAEKGVDPTATMAETRRFVNFVSDKILGPKIS